MLDVHDLVKTFHSGSARITPCDHITFSVPRGGFFTLLGPSGSGKTTTLRCVAGLERPDAGEIRLDGVPLYSAARRIHVPAHRRGIGMVFQSYGLWPHMTVLQHVEFPLTVGGSRLPRREVQDRALEALAAVRLEGLEGRPAVSLSGGQQQRLALARALVRRPKLLLLDEPLSNLDAKLREHMRIELRQLQRSSGITMLYVTHDQVEALVLSDAIAIIHEGRIVQAGTPRAIYERPQTAFVADFIGSTNLFPGTVLRAGPQARCSVQTAGGVLDCVAASPVQPGCSVNVSVRPEDVTIVDRRATVPQWDGVLEEAVFLGGSVDCRVRVGPLVVRVAARPSVPLALGSQIGLEFNSDRAVALPIQPEDAGRESQRAGQA
ncbi:MAG: ABC transporter ATP-binding protein [Armatimonadota bacterium]|nr:ABC transporter ATP-binding protein [Armatimonadota bacterium]